MAVKLVFLGTAASTPTKRRNLSSVALKQEGLWLLFDCPEGTQRQMMKASVSYMKIQYMFISHFHGDHFLGLPGLLATMSMHGRDYPLTIFGPTGVKEHVKKAIELSMLRVNFDIRCVKVRKGLILEEKNFIVRAFQVKHDVPCIGYVFKEKDKLGQFSRKKALKLGLPEGPLWGKLQKGEIIEFKGKRIKPEQVLDLSKGRKGKKISIVFDTLPNKSYWNEIKQSDVLIHEASFLDEMRERAKQTFHTTARQAGGIAEKTNCKKLILTHISARHKDESKLENEARMEFNDVTVANDLMEIEV